MADAIGCDRQWNLEKTVLVIGTLAVTWFQKSLVWSAGPLSEQMLIMLTMYITMHTTKNRICCCLISLHGPLTTPWQSIILPQHSRIFYFLQTLPAKILCPVLFYISQPVNRLVCYIRVPITLPSHCCMPLHLIHRKLWPWLPEGWIHSIGTRVRKDIFDHQKGYAKDCGTYVDKSQVNRGSREERTQVRWSCFPRRNRLVWCPCCCYSCQYSDNGTST